MYDALRKRLAERGLAIDEAKAKTRADIIDYLRQAVVDNKAFLAIASPTAAQRNAQVERLTRQIIRVERLLLNDPREQE